MQILVNALIAGSFAALMAAGLSLVYGVLGIFNMALGQMALVGGYTAWWLSSLSLPLPIAVAGGLAMGMLVAALSFELAIAPFYQRHRFLPLVSTIALSVILDGLLLMMFRETPRTLEIQGSRLHHVFHAVISTEQSVMILMTIMFIAVLAWFLAATPTGRRIRSCVQHPAAAESLGIRSSLLHRSVFLLSGFLAAAAGIFQAIDLSLTPVLGFTITIKAYAALIAGGKDSVSGTVLCAYLIALIEQLVVGVPWFGSYVPAGYQGTIALLIIILMVLVRPHGLFGSSLRRT